MAQPCGICCHASRSDIEAVMLRGESCRSIALHFPGISKDVVSRHRRHIVRELAKADATHPGRLAAEVRTLIDEATRLRNKAERHKDYRTAMHGLGVALNAIELYGRATGELDPHNQMVVQVTMTPTDGITEAVALLLLLADRAGLLRIASQLQERAAYLEASPAIGAASVQQPPQLLEGSDLETQ